MVSTGGDGGANPEEQFYWYMQHGGRADAGWGDLWHATVNVYMALREFTYEVETGSHSPLPDLSQCTIGSFLGLSNAQSGTTRLWRAVTDKELEDIMRYGDYNIHQNSTFKRFAFTERDVDNFIRANPMQHYTKTYIDLPTDKLQLMFQHDDPGGVGKAIGIDVYEHPEFYNWFEDVTIVP